MLNLSMIMEENAPILRMYRKEKYLTSVDTVSIENRYM